MIRVLDWAQAVLGYIMLAAMGWILWNYGSDLRDISSDAPDRPFFRGQY